MDFKKTKNSDVKVKRQGESLVPKERVRWISVSPIRWVRHSDGDREKAVQHTASSQQPLPSL